MEDSDNESTSGVNPYDLLMHAIRDEESLEVVQFILGHSEIHVNDLIRLISHALESNKSNTSDVICALIEHEPETARIRIQHNDGIPFLLHLACSCNATTQIIRLLIEVNPDALDIAEPDTGNLPLHYACCFENASLETIRLLLSHRPESIKACNSEDMRPLHLVLNYGASEEVILHLIDCSPDVASFYCRDLGIPLFFAYSASLAVVQRLVDVYPESVTIAYPESDNLPLHVVCDSMDIVPFEVIQFLSQQYPDAAGIRGEYYQLPLHSALRRTESDRRHDHELQVVQLLIDLYPDAVELADENGWLPIHYACRHCASVDTVQLLLDPWHNDESVGLDQSDRDGRAPLHHAAGSGPHDANPFHLMPAATMQLLLDRYPEGVRTADNEGMLPLHWLCTVTSEESIVEHVRVLVEADIFTTLKTRHDGMTPLQLAFNSDHRQSLECRQFLLSKQDEALGLLHGAFLPAVEHYNLPDLPVSEIWSFVFKKPWRPTLDEMNA